MFICCFLVGVGGLIIVKVVEQYKNFLTTKTDGCDTQIRSIIIKIFLHFLAIFLHGDLTPVVSGKDDEIQQRYKYHKTMISHDYFSLNKLTLLKIKIKMKIYIL